MDSVARHEHRPFPTWVAVVGVVTIVAIALMVMYDIMWMWTAAVALVGIVALLLLLRDYSHKNKRNSMM